MVVVLRALRDRDFLDLEFSEIHGLCKLPPEAIGIADPIKDWPLIPADEILLFVGRLVTGARKRRNQPRYAEVNAARLKLARLCIECALEARPEAQYHE